MLSAILSSGTNGMDKAFRATVSMVPSCIPTKIAEAVFDKRIEMCINELCND